MRGNNKMEEKIIFEKLDKERLPILKEWWHSERVRKFWDNSEEMEQDVDNYALKGEKTYYDYYIGLYNGVPYALVMTSEQTKDDFYEPYENYLSKTGKTYAVDFMIGNEDFVGKHLSSITLRTFVEQYSDEEADRFIIDPAFDNELAFKCYKGAGFAKVGEFIVNDGFFKGKRLHLMIRGREREKEILSEER
jgi:RimJ/RimL family protein N-acetyltransferase